jgi:hypothetical protein
VRVRVWRNRLTADDEGVQIRLGPDDRWHPYTREGRGSTAQWWPCAPATADPVAALVAARTAAAQHWRTKLAGAPEGGHDDDRMGRAPALDAAASAEWVGGR